MQLRSLSASFPGLAWARPLRASSDAGPDTVVLQGERPAPLTAPSSSLPSEAPELMALRNALADDDKLGDRQPELVRLAQGRSDPLAARLARVLLDDHGDYASAVEMWRAEHGDAVAYLEA
ncbi:MAG: hypothetical protein AB1758_05790, partial [Candidatus Eremiobacterota bacterium]